MKRIIKELQKKRNISDIKRSMLISGMLKPLSLIVNFIYTPALLNYLGNEKYGLWATILSVITWINYCDIGIGNGLRNILTKELTEEKYGNAKKTISTAYIILSAVSFMLLIILGIFSVFFDWKNAFNTKQELGNIMLVSLIFICINFVLALGNIVLYALQISEYIAILNLSTNIINLLGVIFLSFFTKENMLYIAILFGLSTSITYGFNNICIFRKYEFLRPNWKSFDPQKIYDLTSIGILFFMLQISGLIMSTTDNILVTHFFGATEVTPFNISYKLFNVIKGIYFALIIPIWSRTTKAMVENDIKWVKQMLRKIQTFICLFLFFYILMIILFDPISYTWLQKELVYPKGLVSITALSIFADMVSYTYAYILNGMSRLKIQLIIGLLQAIMNIPLSIFFAKICGMEAIGIRLATAILFIFSGAVYAISANNFVKKTETIL